MKPNTCDYLKDKESNYYIITHKENGKLFGNLVYKKKNDGEIKSKVGLCYKKVVRYNNFQIRLPKGEIIFARRFYRKFKSNLPTSWNKLPSILQEIGICSKDIGVFGSFMLELTPYKDIDFCVYGQKAYKLVKDNIEIIKKKLKAKDVSDNYAEKRLKKLGDFSVHNTWQEIWKRRWSTLCFKNNMGMTIRFNHATIPNIKSKITDRKEQIKGIVIKSQKSDFFPRAFYVKTSQGVKKIWTTFWYFQSCIRDNDNVLIRGSLCSDESIRIADFSDYLCILNY